MLVVLTIVEEFKDIKSYIKWLNDVAFKWRSLWEKHRVYEANPSSKPKFFITAAFPYPNGKMHLGHARTYTLTDIYARFKRLEGYNVLFPMGFHYTGTPILAMADAVKDRDFKTLKLFREVYGIPDEVIEKMKDPMFMVKYFHEEIKEAMKLMGYAIDWRREFTTIDPMFNSFICWQFYKLYEKGYITQGTHPVGWDPVVGTPVSMHDTKGDVEPEIGEFTLLFFTLDDGTILPAATLRPETVFGAINIWVNPDKTYVKAVVNGKTWIISKEAVVKLENQLRKVKVIEEFKGEKIVGLKARNPATGWRVPILPASFVNPDIATGIVMSVPAHAPYDYVALKELTSKNKSLLLKIGVKIDELKPIPVVKVPGVSDKLAVDIVEKMGIKSQLEREALDKATKEVYSIEFKRGIVIDDIAERAVSDMVDKYKRKCIVDTVRSLIAGKSVPEAREATIKWLKELGLADSMYEIVNGPIYSRWGNKVIVKILENQWFIDYGLESWKKLSRELINNIRIIPSSFRKDFEEAIEWIKRRACARTRGLGTKLPWDKSWVIESLSDSTIYMAYYTVNHILKRYAIPVDKIDNEVWDYILLGKGDPKEISKKKNIPLNALTEARSEFEYWYPLDSRHSGKDLIKNHLTFFIFNHAGIFPKEKWPKQIVVYGYVLYHGQKMSKSLFNVIPVSQLARELSPDGLRLAIALTSEIDQDLDFREEVVFSVIDQLRRIHIMIEEYAEIVKEYRGKPIPRELQLEDSWIISKFKERLDYSRRALNESRIRDAGNTIFYVIEEDIKRYIEILKAKGRYLDETAKHIIAYIFDAWIRVMSPYTPFFAEEMWERVGGKGFVVNTLWPKVEEEYYSTRAVLAMEYTDRLISDIREIVRVQRRKPRKITVLVVKPNEYNELRKAIEYFELGKPMKDFVREYISKAKDKRIASTKAIQLFKFVSTLPPQLRTLIMKTSIDEKSTIRELSDWIKVQIGAKIEVYYCDEVETYIKDRRKLPLPLKPAIYIEF